MTNLTLDEKKPVGWHWNREQAYVPYSDFMVGAACGAEDAASSPAQCGKRRFHPTSCASARPCSRR